MQKLGHKYDKRTSSDNDAIFDGEKYEIKGSMLNSGTNNFSFLQIRPNQDYDKIIFALFYPDDLVLMEMDKNTIKNNIEKNVFKKQHGGQKGESNTFMYYGNRETLLTIGAKIIQ